MDANHKFSIHPHLLLAPIVSFGNSDLEWILANVQKLLTAFRLRLEYPSYSRCRIEAISLEVPQARAEAHLVPTLISVVIVAKEKAHISMTRSTRKLAMARVLVLWCWQPHWGPFAKFQLVQSGGQRRSL